MLGVIDAGEGGQRMTYRCESCQINWAAGQTRAGACIQCSGGTVRIATENPDADATVLYRMLILNENEAERSKKRHQEFEEFYANVWPSKRPPDVAAEAAGWVGL